MRGVLSIAALAELATGPALLGMLTYSAAVTLYLAWLGFAGSSSGILLWPAVVLHAVLTAFLIRAFMKDRSRS